MELKVSVEVLKQKSNDASTKIASMKEKINQISQLVSQSQRYWTGDAADLYRQGFDQEKETIEIILRRLEEHPKDLLTISGAYENQEKQNIDLMSALPDDVIS